jgi:hypothetical protein
MTFLIKSLINRKEPEPEQQFVISAPGPALGGNLIPAPRLRLGNSNVLCPKYVPVLAQQAFELSYREEQMEFYRDCPIDPDTSSYYCLGGWEEEIRQEALNPHSFILISVADPGSGSGMNNVTTQIIFPRA